MAGFNGKSCRTAAAPVVAARWTITRFSKQPFVSRDVEGDQKPVHEGFGVTTCRTNPFRSSNVRKTRCMQVEIA